MNKFTIFYEKAKKLNLSLLASQFEPTDDDIKEEYNPFEVLEIQNYNPIYNLFFEVSEETYNKIALNNFYHIKDLETLISKKDGVPIKSAIHIKFAPLLDPLHYLIGKYNKKESIQILPKPDLGGAAATNKGDIYKKIMNIYNSAYVDSFFNYLLSQLKHTHAVEQCVDYYGSYLCIQSKFKFNISDDFDYLTSCKNFIDSYDSVYTIDNYTKKDITEIYNSKQEKHLKVPINIDDDADIVGADVAEGADIILNNISFLDGDEIEDLSDALNHSLNVSGGSGGSSSSDHAEHEDNDAIIELDDIDEVDDAILNDFKLKKNRVERGDDGDGEDGDNSSMDSDDSSLNYTTEDDKESVNSADGFNVPSVDGGEDSEETNSSGDRSGSSDHSDDDARSSSGSSDTDSYGDNPFYAYINNFPVQMICLEKCVGTLDELLVDGEIDEKRGTSALFQIVMILIIFQNVFEMTHNDLHTNNIMYINTDKEYLYYYFENKYYRVPTFGRIYKIIDFGRSYYKFKGNIFCSDSFFENGDAHTQYNCEPFYNPKKELIAPNYSFDLCRLGCSIFDFIFSDEDLNDDNLKMDEFQKTIYRWCHNDDGKNVLYKKDGSERYENFSLYKMIARSVHAHIPKLEISKYKAFYQYQIKPRNVTPQIKKELLNIDKLPSYASADN